MAIIRENRSGKETIRVIKDIETYINNNYLKGIQDKIQTIKEKKKQLKENLDLYNLINSNNQQLKESLLTNSKYLELVNRQTNADKEIDNLNILLNELLTILSFRTIITNNNLLIKQDQSDNDKVDIIEGEFTSLQVPKPRASNACINKQYFEEELLKLEKLPQPLPPLKYLATDLGGNLIWK